MLVCRRRLKFTSPKFALNARHQIEIDPPRMSRKLFPSGNSTRYVIEPLAGGRGRAPQLFDGVESLKIKPPAEGMEFVSAQKKTSGAAPS